MAYSVYTTEGLVLGSTPRGEADRSYSIFTKDLGLIFATARGVRKEESKLKGALQDLTLATLSFVRGKKEWRITAAFSEENLFARFRHERRKFEMVTRVSSLLSKLVAGEEVNVPLFEIVHSALLFLSKNPFSDNVLHDFECILVLRILNALGYVAKTSNFEEILQDNVWNEHQRVLANSHKREIIRSINTALEASQLTS